MLAPIPIHTIVLHVGPHVDEIAALFILRSFGESVFPGIKNAKLLFVDASSMPGDGQSEKDGYLAVGVWRGRLDEHPGETQGRKEGESACSLVLKALGLEQVPVLAKISEAVTVEDLGGRSRELNLGGCGSHLHRKYRNKPMQVIGWTSHALTAIYEALCAETDLKGVSVSLDLASCVKYLDRKYPNNSAEVKRWENFALDAIHEAWVRFHTVVREEYIRNAETTVVPGYRGRKTRIVHVETDSPEMLGFARSRFAGITQPGRAEILVLRNSSGQVLVSVGQHLDPNVFNDLVLMIRVEERRIKKLGSEMWTKLMGGGTAPGVHEWFVHPDMRLLLNGGGSSPGTLATQIPLERIRELVCIAANPQAFEPKRKEHCLKAACTNTPESPCSWYDLGLRRCRAIRAQEHEQRRTITEAQTRRPTYSVR